MVGLIGIDVFRRGVVPGQYLKRDESKDERELPVKGTGAIEHKADRLDDLFVGGDNVVDREGLVDARRDGY